MVGLLLPVLIAAVAAALWAGSLAGLRRIRIDWWPLALGSMGVQLIIHNPPWNQQAWALAWGAPIWVLCLACMLAVLIRNAVRPGITRFAWALAALGVGLNLTVVLANGGSMPQSMEARLAARGTPMSADANVTQLSNVTVLGPETRLAPLSDVIAQPRWLPRANVVSIGDIVLCAGLVGLTVLTLGVRPAQVGGPLADS
jgi:hypothetical protein